MVTLTIDDKEIKAKKGDILLWVALDNGFYIPNLCTLRDFLPSPASCRLCFVEIDGHKSPVTSCTIFVDEGMKVRLNTEKVEGIRKTAFDLLLSNHSLDCGSCKKNKKCELQNIAAKLKYRMKPGKFRNILKELPVDNSHPLFDYNPNKCVLCSRCIEVCRRQGANVLDFAFRGINSRVSTFNNIPLSEACSSNCMACVTVCPVGSLIQKDR